MRFVRNYAHFKNFRFMKRFWGSYFSSCNYNQIQWLIKKKCNRDKIVLTTEFRYFSSCNFIVLYIRDHTWSYRACLIFRTAYYCLYISTDVIETTPSNLLLSTIRLNFVYIIFNVRENFDNLLHGFVLYAWRMSSNWEIAISC